MIELSELLRRRALDVSRATAVGRVTGVGLVGDRIVSIGVDGDRIPSSAVHGFDGDVVTFLTVPGDHDRDLPTPIDPRGVPVFDLKGELLGTIADLTITPHGVVHGISLREGATLSGARLLAVRSSAAIVGDETPPALGTEGVGGG